MLALPCLLVTMDITVRYRAVPELTRELQPGSSQLLWITDVYGFLFAGSLITMTSRSSAASGPPYIAARRRTRRATGSAAPIFPRT